MNVSNLSSKSTHLGTQWFREGIIYEIFVRSFRDSNGDGIGDLHGIIDSLDYIQSLGVTIIWLMPIHPSPSYHGYDITDYYAVNPDYGTLDDLFELISEVHKRGMYILMDYVANHTSNHHPFYRDALNNLYSEHRNFYCWKNEFHSAAHGFGRSGSMPEVNFDDPAARQYMIDIARYWLDPDGDGDPSDGFDGLRCDVAVGPPLDFWAELRTAMLTVNSDSILLAEAWLHNTYELQAYLTSNSFNAVFDFPTFHTFAADHNKNGDGIIAGAVPSDFLTISLNSAQLEYPIDSHIVRFLNNHDTNRIMSEVEGDEDRARAAAVWLLTAPHTPMLYYGEEIGMFGIKGNGNPYWDESRREPFRWYSSEDGEGMTSWLKIYDNHHFPDDGISVEESETNPDSLFNFYRKITALRNETPALRNGDFGNVDLSPKGVDLYAVWRGNIDGEFFLILINFGLESIMAEFTGDVPKINQLNLNIVMSNGFTLDGTSFSIEPAGYAIIAAHS